MQKSQSTCWKIEGRGKGSILLTMCAFSSSRDPSTVNKAPCIGICQQNCIREGSKPKSSQRSKSQQKKIVREGGGAHLIQNLHFSPHELLMSLHSKALKSEEMGCEWDFGCVVHAAQGKRVSLTWFWHAPPYSNLVRCWCLRAKQNIQIRDEMERDY